MIKIEITDVSALEPHILKATAEYLISCIPLETRTNEFNADSTSRFHSEPIYQHEFSADSTSRFHSEPIYQHEFSADITEELIPVSSEIVNIPTPPAFNPFASAPAVELDSEGLPWDGRIHARTKTKTKDGKWKIARNIGPRTVNEVQNELKTVQEIPVSPEVSEFTTLMNLVTSSTVAGKLNKIMISTILNNFGIPSLAVVSTRPDLIPAVITAIEVAINESR